MLLRMRRHGRIVLCKWLIKRDWSMRHELNKKQNENMQKSKHVPSTGFNFLCIIVVCVRVSIVSVCIT